MTLDTITDRDIEIVSLTVFGEARGESTVGQSAVIWVIRHRWENPGWWSRPNHTLADVCLVPYQFSCWNRNDPNYARLTNPATKQRADYRAIRALVIDVLSADAKDDITHGADHYCTVAVAPHVKWARGKLAAPRIGNHLFYRLGLDGK